MDYRAFVGGSYRSQSYVSDQERTVNRFLEVIESDGATRKTALYPVPGFRAFAAVMPAGCRGMFTEEQSGRVFAIFGTSFDELLADGTVVNRGEVALDGNQVTYCANGNDQVFVTAGDRGYCLTLSTNAFAEVLSSGATIGGFLDGYFIAFNLAGNEIRISDLFDGMVWDPTQYLQRSTSSDPWRSMVVTPYYQILMPGATSGDVLSNVGSFPFPFAPDKSGSFAEGIAATFSLQQTSKATTWIASNKNGGARVLAATGFNPVRISDHGMERAMAQMPRIDDAIGQTYEEQGHLFLLLTFPSAGQTWAYDFTTQVWHERGTWISEENRYSYSRPVFHCFGHGKHLMGDRESNVVYEMTDEVSTDVDGRPLRWLRRAPAIFNENKNIIVHRIELFMEMGIGSSDTGQGHDPVLMIRASRDFGQAFGAERQLRVGKQGERWRRVSATRFGKGRGWVFEASGSDPVPMRLSGASLEIERLAA